MPRIFKHLAQTCNSELKRPGFTKSETARKTTHLCVVSHVRPKTLSQKLKAKRQYPLYKYF